MGKFRIDLHIHTLYSDGLAEPADIVACAKDLGYETIAVTDHDGTGGVYEAQEAGRQCGIRVISGIELATETGDGIGAHILGYDFDMEDRKLRETLDRLKRYREERNEALVKVLNDMGCDMTMEELRERQPHGYIGKPVMARLLAEKGYISDYRDAFRMGQFIESPEARKVKRIKMDTVEAVEMINGAGGIAVMAHPIQTKDIGTQGSEEFFDSIDGIIGDLHRRGLGGLECYHPDQNAAQTKRFIDIASKYGLQITRGSDFHGSDFRNAESTADLKETGSPELISFSG